MPPTKIPTSIPTTIPTNVPTDIPATTVPTTSVPSSESPTLTATSALATSQEAVITETPTEAKEFVVAVEGQSDVLSSESGLSPDRSGTTDSGTGAAVAILSLLLMGGVGSVGAAGFWGFTYLRGQQDVNRFKDGSFLFSNCPVCRHNPLAIRQEYTNLLGIPRVRRSAHCPVCSFQIDQKQSKVWKVSLDRQRHPLLAWLYDGELLSELELIGFSQGKHTAKAYRKLVDKSRHDVLGALLQGQIDALAGIMPEAISRPNNQAVRVKDITDNNLAFILKKDEKPLLVCDGVMLAELKTRTNRKTKQQYVEVVPLTNGQFSVTNQQYIFIANDKKIAKSLDKILTVDVRSDRVGITRTDKKTTEWFIGLDGEIVKALLQGLIRN